MRVRALCASRKGGEAFVGKAVKLTVNVMLILFQFLSGCKTNSRSDYSFAAFATKERR